MPQWHHDRDADRARYPDERKTAACSRAVAELLVLWDHHTVWLEGRRALLLTYHWSAAPLSEQPEPLTFAVSFTYAPGHPNAPPEVQRAVEALTFSAAPTTA